MGGGVKWPMAAAMAAAMAAGEAVTGDGAGWLGVMAERCPVHGRQKRRERRRR